MKRRICSVEECRHGNDSRAVHCARCGNRLPVRREEVRMRWGACGHLSRSDVRFCAQCGVRFDTMPQQGGASRLGMSHAKRGQNWGGLILLGVVVWIVLKSC